MQTETMRCCPGEQNPTLYTAGTRRHRVPCSGDQHPLALHHSEASVGKGKSSATAGVLGPPKCCRYACRWGMEHALPGVIKRQVQTPTRPPHRPIAPTLRQRRYYCRCRFILCQGYLGFLASTIQTLVTNHAEYCSLYCNQRQTPWPVGEADCGEA